MTVELETALAAAIIERDEALSFARSEARRNGDLAAKVEHYENRERRDHEAVSRIRDTLISHGYWHGSYFGVRDSITRERIADTKYTPPFELIEQFVDHLLKAAGRTPKAAGQ